MRALGQRESSLLIWPMSNLHALRVFMIIVPFLNLKFKKRNRFAHFPLSSPLFPFSHFSFIFSLHSVFSKISFLCFDLVSTPMISSLWLQWNFAPSTFLRWVFLTSFSCFSFFLEFSWCWIQLAFRLAFLLCICVNSFKGITGGLIFQGLCPPILSYYTRRGFSLTRRLEKLGGWVVECLLVVSC